jgi:hypothetical protein
MSARRLIRPQAAHEFFRVSPLVHCQSRDYPHISGTRPSDGRHGAPLVAWRLILLELLSKSRTEKLVNGWTTERGDHVRLENVNYKPWSGSVP